ncbi:MAG: dihydropyrimidinase [Firmicutes bacterium]|nr:dihydropyrimidinase [Bacillota bacterium]
MNNLLIKGGTVVTSRGNFNGDVLIQGGKIQALGEEIKVSDIPIIDASDRLVLPGIIDAHVQLECAYKETVMTDDFATGTKAAAAGGVTTIIDFADQEQSRTPLEELEQRMAIADAKVNVDYSLHLGVTNIKGEQLAQLEEAVWGHKIGSFKLYMAYRNRGRLVDEGQIYAIMREAARLGAVVGVHAENEPLIDNLLENLVREGKTGVPYFASSRPDLAEQMSITIAGQLAEATGATLYIHHLSTAAGLEAVRDARRRGVPVYAETCPQYLVLTDDVYQQSEGCLYVMNPPLRGAKDREALWEGVIKGEIQVIGTDHCSYTRAQKGRSKDFRNIPAGIPGIETLLPVMYSEGVATGKIDLSNLVELLALNPAQIFGLYPQKGDIQVGADGDVVLFDPRVKWAFTAENLHMNVDYSPFSKLNITGRVDKTILRGTVIYEEGRWCGQENCGRFVPAQVASAGVKLD